MWCYRSAVPPDALCPPHAAPSPLRPHYSKSPRFHARGRQPLPRTATRGARRARHAAVGGPVAGAHLRAVPRSRRGHDARRRRRLRPRPGGGGVEAVPPTPKTRGWGGRGGATLSHPAAWSAGVPSVTRDAAAVAALPAPKPVGRDASSRLKGNTGNDGAPCALPAPQSPPASRPLSHPPRTMFITARALPFPRDRGWFGTPPLVGSPCRRLVAGVAQNRRRPGRWAPTVVSATFLASRRPRRVRWASGARLSRLPFPLLVAPCWVPRARNIGEWCAVTWSWSPSSIRQTGVKDCAHRPSPLHRPPCAPYPPLPRGTSPEARTWVVVANRGPSPGSLAGLTSCHSPASPHVEREGPVPVSGGTAVQPPARARVAAATGETPVRAVAPHFYPRRH